MKYVFLSVVAIIGSFVAQGQNSDKNLKFLVAGALEFGGDEVAKVFFTNGGDQSVNAGQGGAAHIGLEYAFDGFENLRLRSTIGYKYVTTAAENANITLTRIPIHATLNYVVKDNGLRLSAGIASHRNIKFNGDGFLPTFEFLPSTGPIFEVAYAWIGVSYTSMKYTGASYSYDASCIGVTFSGTF